MLSRVADSLYWMSRYFERASHCARVLEANFSLMLNPGKVSTGQRWENVIAHLGMGALAAETEPQAAILRKSGIVGHTHGRTRNSTLGWAAWVIPAR